MNHRFRTSIRLLTIVFAVVLPITAPLAGQAPSSSAKASATAKRWTAKTSDGQPDLQGYWTNSTYTPLQRPNGVTKEFYNREEVVQIEKQPGYVMILTEMIHDVRIIPLDGRPQLPKTSGSG